MPYPDSSSPSPSQESQWRSRNDAPELKRTKPEAAHGSILVDVSGALVLGIGSTYDEAGIGIVRGCELLIDRTATPTDQYARYGGIIPEVVSCVHPESFLPTLDSAFGEAGVTLKEIDTIGVAAGPGLVGSLTVGICATKALASALDKSLYGVNHIIGHLAIDKLTGEPLPQRSVGLVVSGGHSNILLVEGIATDVEELGGILDDAASETFDKIGRLLELPYPGGLHVDWLSQFGNVDAIRSPRDLVSGKDEERYKYDFSFSGLKTAVTRYIESTQARGEEFSPKDVYTGFSEAINDSLTSKAVRAVLDTRCSSIAVGGGFSANSRLCSLLSARTETAGIEVRMPPLRFCTDNGAQIVALASELVRAGMAPSDWDSSPDSSMALTHPPVLPR